MRCKVFFSALCFNLTRSFSNLWTQASVFVQSHVRAHAELMWLLSSTTPIGWLNKMIQFKEKSRKSVYFLFQIFSACICLHLVTFSKLGWHSETFVQGTVNQSCKLGWQWHSVNLWILNLWYSTKWSYCIRHPHIIMT